jgi:hypothetical protein
LSSSDPSHIRVRFEADVPTGAAHAGDADKSGEKFTPFFTPVNPQAGQPTWVKPPASGSGTSLGSICAKVTFGGTAGPFVVVARVTPTAFYPGDTQTPHASAKTGVASASNTCWSWDDSNLLAGADHSPDPGSPNVFAVWRLDTTASNWRFDGKLTFQGITGSNGPCGAPGSGSGSGSGLSPLIFQGATFPALWCMSVAGLTGPEAVFNSLHALRHDRPGTPNWGNGGDGVHAPRLALAYDPARKDWTLTMQLGKLHLTAAAAFTQPFASLRFAIGGKAPAAAHIVAEPV